VIATESGQSAQLDPIVMPGSEPAWITHVVARGLAHARDEGLDAVSLEADPADTATREALVEHGFSVEDGGYVETWLHATARPAISPLHDGYRLASRRDTMQRPHHMIHAGRNHADVEPRLRQTSLYRPELDLVVHDSQGDVAAYGLFWYDPATATGLVEPMRTEDHHQRRGLARHVLTTGVDRLAQAGAERIKICYDADNSASEHLYLDVGFRPVRRTVVFTGRLGRG
jgi:predicted N-acetyltransferase YhbS